MTDEEIIERLRIAIMRSAPPGTVGHYHADLYARTALAELRAIEAE